jgi:hypothetical protein
MKFSLALFILVILSIALEDASRRKRPPPEDFDKGHDDGVRRKR